MAPPPAIQLSRACAVSPDAPAAAVAARAATASTRVLACAGVHMYSLNQDKSVLEILEQVGLLDTKVTVRRLPFRARTRAPGEAVRPVYWQNRPKSYVQRTAKWSTFPEASWKEAACAPCA